MNSNRRGASWIDAVGLALREFYKGAPKYTGKNIPGFKGWPGQARERGRKKQRAKQSALALENLHPNDRQARHQKAFEKATKRSMLSFLSSGRKDGSAGSLKRVLFNGKMIPIK